VNRRQVFGWCTLGGGVGFLAGFLPKAHLRKSDAAASGLTSADCISPRAIDAPMAGMDMSRSAYGSAFGPPSYLPNGSRDGLHAPPPISTERTQTIALSIVETTLEVADGRNVRVWTYGGNVPGPIIRATEGDTLRIVLTNQTSELHNIHFHGAHDVNQDGIDYVRPGASRVYEMTAGPFGLHPYHCHVPPYALHISRGLYGALIVDPPKPRPPAHEFVLCLGSFRPEGSGPGEEIYAWNGVAGYYERYPLKVPVGDLVRLYIVNLVEDPPIVSFHLHAQTFDVYRSGTSLTPHEHTDIVSLGAAERAIVEFRLPRRGRYMFHPHQSRVAERGAMGWVVAV
jgi:FtsP/CotA-like multicopper oxidase with cupredoxin domain